VFGQQDARPDVLFIAIDDLNDWVGVLGGHPQAITPNIDALAARGMLFTNAHTAAPLCNPSRTALMSGLRPSTSGVYQNAPDWRPLEIFEDIRTLPGHFQDAGYRTYGAGKLFHAGTFNPNSYFGFNDTTAWDAFYPSLARQVPDEIRPHVRPANGNPQSVNFDWGTVSADDRAMGDGQVVAWSQQQLLVETGKPRFNAVGIYRPHLPWYLPQKYFDLHPLENIRLPATIENDLDDISEIAQAQGITSNNMRPMELHKWVLEAGAWREGVRAYLASISFADAMLGQLLSTLEQSGRSDSTIIVLWSDHGWHLGEKARWRKSTLWRESTRVPLIIVAPGITQPGSSSDVPVSLMDLYPTLTELTGLETPGHIEGESLVPLLNDPQAPRDRAAVVTTFGYRNHAVTGNRYRYITYSDGNEELYDIQTDPNEWTNRADDPLLAGVKAALIEWLPEHDEPDARGL
jgi:arylsulfatase A-like enzyme